MDANPPVIAASTTIAELSDRIARGDPVLSRRQGTILLDPAGRLAGLVTRGDLMRVPQEGTAATTTALDASGGDLAVTYPDETLRTAIARMLARNVGRLPVVDRTDPGKVVGYLGRADILSARLRHHEEEERREKG
jgi:CBS domain-containing protein